MMKILSILFCLLTSSLCADFESSFADPCLIEASCRDLENPGIQYEDLNPTAVSEQESLPSGVIDGVNVVSGEYSTGAIDGYVTAPSRFAIDRTYHQNKEMRNGATGFHWRMGFLWKVFPEKSHTPVKSGGYVYSETCAEVMHYCSDKDYVPLLDYRGREREKRYITMLKSHPNAKGMDHSFTSPTYEEAIKYNFNKFINRGNSL